ncbi:TetR/AcrR family transcriptional regulator [Paenarthrobacter nitroguajacolicus]|uniref:TetR/AcrR family transcriptional regulator n=1 Tax=Paenarthrobacter nitroguajacolicus TaxID=211146 RepID=UPI00342ED500
MTASLTSRGPYKKGVQRRGEIIDAAARIFARHGYHAGSLRHIAEEVGVTGATLISYFGSKEGLLVAVLKRWQEESSRWQGPHTGLEHIRALVMLMRYHTTHRGFIELFLTLSTEASNPDHPARDFIVKRYEDTVHGFRKQLLTAIDAGDILPLPDHAIDLEVRSLIALMDGLELQWLLNPDLDLVSSFQAQLNITISRWTGKSIEEVALETQGWLDQVDSGRAATP